MSVSVCYHENYTPVGKGRKQAWAEEGLYQLGLSLASAEGPQISHDRPLVSIMGYCRRWSPLLKESFSPWPAFLSPWPAFLSPWSACLSRWPACVSPWPTCLSPWSSCVSSPPRPSRCPGSRPSPVLTSCLFLLQYLRSCPRQDQSEKE